MTNGHLGLKLCRAAVEACLPGEHPALDWVFRRYES